MVKAKLRIPDTIVSFNGKVGRGGNAMIKSVKDLLKDHPSTDVFCFQECEGYIEELRREFNGGWYLYVRGGWDESRMSPVMVRKAEGFPKREYGAGWGVVRNKLPWEHKKRKPGRTWTWVKVGQVWVMSLHRVTDGNGENKRAYREEAKRLVNFMERGNDRSIIIVGDTNTGYRATHDGSMRDVRAQVGGRLIADQSDPGIDYALTSQHISAHMRRTKRYGSDHQAAVMSRIRLS